MTLDELKQIEEGAICPECGHAFVHHSMQSGCAHCECKLNHYKATRLALSNAIEQIEQALSIVVEMQHYSDPNGATIRLLNKIEDTLLAQGDKQPP